MDKEPFIKVIPTNVRSANKRRKMKEIKLNIIKNIGHVENNRDSGWTLLHNTTALYSMKKKQLY